jgi:putative membrane protein
METGRTLVLSVDRDDDIGFKARISSPVIGRAACLAAATSLGLADPEDSDVNAIFSAVKLYDELKSRGEQAEIAIVAGDHMHMIEGDRRIASSLGEVIRETKATGCIVVTDGAEDEFVVPIIQSCIPVTSIRRVIVNQMPNLEGTYYIIKKLLNDPKISRFLLVPLGLAMILFAIANFLGYPQVATYTVVAVIGAYLLYRGLQIDDVLRDFFGAMQTSLRRARFSFVTYIAGILLMITGIVLGLMSILQFYTSNGSFGFFQYFLTFLYGAALWMMLGGIVASSGIIVDNFLYEREALGKVIVYPFFIGSIGVIAYGVSVYVISLSNVPEFPYAPDIALQYISYGTLAGFTCGFVGVGLQYLINRWIVAHISAQIIEVV